MEVLLVLQIIVVLALIGVILVQKSSSDGFTGGSSPNSFMTGRASANLLTRTTAILATVFLVNSLVLAYIASHSEHADSVLDQAAKEVEGKKDAAKTPADKALAPKAEDKKSDTGGKTEPVKEPAKPAVPAAE